MASAGDVRDIFNLAQDGPRHAVPKKKKKTLENQARLSGMSREVQALMGDSVPPVAIVETPKYKQKPSMAMKMFKPRHWEERSFVHGARKDGLNLKHWKRSIPGSNIRIPIPANGATADVEMTGTDADVEAPSVTELRFEDEFPSEKWNVEVTVPSYSDEQYERFFKSEDWTKEETDYMMQLCQDYDLRWLLIADRYEPADIPVTKIEDAPEKLVYNARRMEEIKQRYYTVAAKMLELQTPASNMTQSEFQLWEKMRNFDARTEVQRKAMAEKLFERTKEEADEEKVLLEELYRITKNEDDFIKMRKELYSRLETAPSLRRNERGEEPSTALYQTSQGLSMLLSSLLAKEKRLKSRVAPNGQEGASTTQTPTDAQRPRPGPQHSRRDTIDSHAGNESGPAQRKGSISQAPVVRTLAPAEEVKFGVSHPQERLTSGVMFRHEKINRLTMAKSQVQTQKIGAALTELGIPPRLLMPTERVCREFERLVSEVQILLDTRRVLEKVSSEVKVLEEHKKLRLGGGQDGADGQDDKGEAADAMELDSNAALVAQQEKAGANMAAREGVNAAAARPGEVRINTGEQDGEERSTAGDDTVIDTQDKDDAEVDDSQMQGDDDEDEDNEVDQSAMADDDEDADDVDQSFAQQDDEEEEEEDVDQDQDDDEELRLNQDDDEEDEDDDDAPGLDDLERANQVTDDEDEDNTMDQLRVADNDEEEEEEEEEEGDEDGDNDQEGDDDNDVNVAEDDQAEVDESMMNGGEEEDDDNDEDRDDVEEEEESRPTSSHSNARAHKRSASVISESSRAGSNRSGASRKRRR